MVRLHTIVLDNSSGIICNQSITLTFSFIYGELMSWVQSESMIKWPRIAIFALTNVKPFKQTNLSNLFVRFEVVKTGGLELPPPLLKYMESRLQPLHYKIFSLKMASTLQNCRIANFFARASKFLCEGYGKQIYLDNVSKLCLLLE